MPDEQECAVAQYSGGSVQPPERRRFRWLSGITARNRYCRLLLLCLLLVCLPTWESVAVPSAAGAKPPAGTTEGRAVDTPAHGDSMVMGMLGEPSTLLPFLATDTASHQVAGQFFVAPLKYDKDLNVVPYAAESFEILEDGLLLRFTLKRGLHWQDGVELTADDVEFTYKLMIDPNTPTAYSGDFKAIEAFTKLDRYSFEVRYKTPFPRSLNTWMQSIMPKHALEGRELRGNPLGRNPISVGPYVMREWQPGAMISLASNPAYFDGEPYVSDVIYSIIPDETTMFLELKAGKLDVLPSLSPHQYLYQAQTEAFQREFATYRSLNSAYTYLGYNLKNPLFADVRVRRALAYAINKKDIVKVALFGQGETTIGPYKLGTWAYNDAIEDYPHDPERALELLRELGWERDSGGILRKNGMPFSFTLLTNQGNEPRIKTAVMLQSQLRKIGIEVKIKTVEWAAFLKQFINTGFFDAVILGWTITQDPDAYDVWHSSRIGMLNFTGFANAEVDSLLEKARSTFDQTIRKALYDRFQVILHQEQPYCFLYISYGLPAIQRRFRGIDPAPAGVFHNTEKWWVPLDEQRHRMQAQ